MKTPADLAALADGPRLAPLKPEALALLAEQRSTESALILIAQFLQPVAPNAAAFVQRLSDDCAAPQDRRRRRLDRRNAAIREACALLCAAGATDSAQALSERLNRYVSAGGWSRPGRTERDAVFLDDGADRLRVLLHRIARLGGGDGSLGVAQIRNICDGDL